MKFLSALFLLVPMLGLPACNSMRAQTEQIDTAAKAVGENEGVFTVTSSDGIVIFDYLFDGGNHLGEVAVFSLGGMTDLQPGSPEYINEALSRVAPGSNLGKVIISDPTQGARYDDASQISSDLLNSSVNAGPYAGPQSFELTTGSRFALLFVTNDTVENARAKASAGEALPDIIFSQYEANTFRGYEPAHLVTVDGAKIFGFEDLFHSTANDSDFNDVVFNVEGATTNVESLCEIKGTCPEPRRLSENFIAPLDELTALHPACTFDDIVLSDGYPAACISAAHQYCSKKPGYAGGVITEIQPTAVQVSCYAGTYLEADYATLASYHEGCSSLQSALSIENISIGAYTGACTVAASRFCIANGYAGGTPQEITYALLGFVCSTPGAVATNVDIAELAAHHAGCTVEQVFSNGGYTRACAAAANRYCQVLDGGRYEVGFLTERNGDALQVQNVCVPDFE